MALPHSGEYFGDYRDFWWNFDFLQLMAKRWELDKVTSILDVGCGLGHWGQVLEPHLPKYSTLIGVDMEDEWVQKAQERANKLGLEGRFSYQKGDANVLPFPNDSFDMVTCQTVLIHMPNSKKTIREMVRVLKPGGLLAVSEPNNLIGSITTDSLSFGNPIEGFVDNFELLITCERGKWKLGEGFSSVGDLLPGYFSESGLKDIQVFLSDKCSPLFSPYEQLEQKILLQQMAQWREKENGPEDRQLALEYFLAGGGTQERFDQIWSREKSKGLKVKESLEQGTYHTGGAALMYLVSGRKSN